MEHFGGTDWLAILVGVMRIANSNKIIDLLLQGIKAYQEYACQLSRLTCHAYRLKTLISFKGNFSCLTKKSGQIVL